ncbi:MAG TPA: hypothetical protein VM638_03185, partial [Actinomycetota bacterium]|nr:hypothetical protein [Actinomycetota bacterium]
GSVTVDAGRSRVVELTPEEGGEPVAVLVEGPDASLVVAGAGVTEAGYSLALGVRLDPLRVP